MTSDEAAKLLVLMQATWPKVAEGDVATRLWLEDLMALEAETARQAWRKLRDTREFAPSWALFLEAYYAQAPSRPAIGGEPYRPYGEVTYTREGQERIAKRLEEIRTRPVELKERAKTDP